MNRTPTLFLFAVLASAFGPSAARAQPPSAEIAITLRPAGEPRPALKYRLVPEGRDLVPGNAAIFYHRALLMLNQARTRAAAAKEGEAPPVGRPVTVDEPVSRWIWGPIAAIPRDQARAVLATFEPALREVDAAVTRSTCDWGFEKRTEGVNLPIPEIQEMRTLARLQALRARLAILDGRVDEAFRWIEDGFVMGHHVGQGPIVIQTLVGVAIDFVMVRCLEEFIQIPGAPNLFWALADRPRPMIDLRAALEGERYVLEKELPTLAELDRGPWSLDQARRFADEMQRKIFALAGDSTPASETGGVALRQLGVAAICSKIYPEARRALIAAGKPEAEVEAMPVVQVATLHSYREYQLLRDESTKWMNLPYWQSFDRVDPTNLGSVEQKLANPLLALFRMVSPNLNAVRLATVRLDRQLDALQCVELIRLHAASHEGRLPATLGAITEGPAPLDPATGKPFGYEVIGDSAILSGPVPPGAPDHPLYQIRYVLKLAR